MVDSLSVDCPDIAIPGFDLPANDPGDGFATSGPSTVGVGLGLVVGIGPSTVGIGFVFGADVSTMVTGFGANVDLSALGGSFGVTFVLPADDFGGGFATDELPANDPGDGFATDELPVDCTDIAGLAVVLPADDDFGDGFATDELPADELVLPSGLPERGGRCAKSTSDVPTSTNPNNKEKINCFFIESSFVNRLVIPKTGTNWHFFREKGTFPTRL